MVTQGRENAARADTDAASTLRRDAFNSSQEDVHDFRQHSDTNRGANSLQRAASTSSLFAKPASVPFSRNVSSRIPRVALGSQRESESAPGSPQLLSFTSAEPPSSVASTTESVSSNRTFGIRAIDNGTPSRLAQFRTKNWLRDIGKKRALKTDDGTAHPPKRRAVTSLFSDEPRRVFVSVDGGDGGEDDGDMGDFGGDAHQDRYSDTLSVVSYGIRLASQSSSSTDSYEDTRLRLQQEIKVGKCLEQDLTRDNTRMKLKMDSLRDDIDYYYELLARIEAVALNAWSQASHPDGGNASKNASIINLAEAVQHIISAPKSDRNAAIGGEK